MSLGTSGPGETPHPLPRGLVAIGLSLVSLILVALFVLILFPYTRFRDVAIGQLAQATGASVSLDDLQGGPSVGGPSLRATNLLLRWPDRRDLLLERARMRPAWSVSWLRGDPAIHLAMTGPAGSFAGTVWPGPGLALAGRARGIQLSELPFDALADRIPVVGRVDAAIDLRAGPTGPAGEVRFESQDGSIALPGLPFGVPYQQLHGEIERSESGFLTVREFELSGPMVSVAAQGSVAANRGLENAPLDLEVELLVVDPALRSVVQPYGVRLDANGAARLRISGTVSRPVVR